MKKLFVILTIVSLLVFGSLGVFADDVQTTDDSIIITTQDDDTPITEPQPF